MGDVNGFERLRRQVGTQSPAGGIRSGDKFPEPIPWRRIHSPQPDAIPLLLFDMNRPLHDKEYAITIIPSIWEWDGGQDLFTTWGRSVAQHGGALAGGVVSLFYGPAAGFAVKQALDWGLPALYGMGLDTIGSAGDRPIGMTLNGNQLTYSPKIIAMTVEGAAAAAATTVGGLGNGIIALRYTDPPALAGDYSLYLQIEYREYDAGPPQHPV